MPRLVQQRAEKTGVARRYGVQRPHRNQVLGHLGELPQGLVHDARRPEEIHEGGIGAEAPVAFADHLPGRFAMQEIVERQAAGGQYLAGDFTETGERGGRRIAVAHVVMQIAGQCESRAVTLARRRNAVGDRRVVQEMLLEMHDISGEFVFHRAVVLAPAAEKDDGETVLREGADDLVHPARHAAADVGKGAFEQERDVGLRGLGTGREGVVRRHHRWLVQ